MKNKLVKVLTMMLVAGSMLTACGEEEKTNQKIDETVSQTVESEGKTETQITQDTEPETEPESEVVYEEHYYNNFENGMGLVNGEYWYCFLDLSRESDWYVDLETSEDALDSAVAGIYITKPGEEVYTLEFYKLYTDFKLQTKDEIIMTTKDGQEELWVYDAENATLSNGEVTFYERETDFFKNELSQSDYLLSGTYVATYHGIYSTPYAISKEGDYGVELVFNESGSAHAIIDGEWSFCNIEKYSIRDNKIFALTYEETLLRGEIDEATGELTLDGVVYTKVQ